MANNLLQTAKTYFYQNRYAQAIESLKLIEYGSDEYFPSRSLWLRCLCESGKIGQAIDYARHLEIEFGGGLEAFSKNEDLVELHLWINFIKIYSKIEWDGLQTFAGRVLRENSSVKLKALSLDLSIRGGAFAAILLGDVIREQLVETYGEVITAYRKAGLNDEMLHARYRQAFFCFDSKKKLHSTARQLFSTLLSELDPISHPMLRANTSLCLAELDFIGIHEDPESAPDYEKLIKNFQSIVSLFQEAGHPYPEEKVTISAGLLLMEYGIEEGVNFVESSLPEIEKNENYQICQEGWRRLALWHTYHGGLEKLEAAQAHLAELNEKMGFGLSIMVDELGKGDSSFRKGEVTAALEFLKQSDLAANAVLLSASYRIITANVKLSVGLTKESREELEEVIEALEQNNSEQLLSECWTIYASSYINDDLEKAIEFVTKAILAEEKTGNKLSTGQHYAMRGWMKSLHNKRQNMLPIVTEDIERDFDLALGLLQGLRSLEGRNALISMCQQRGQSAFMGNDWDDCGHWLSKAEEYSVALKLHPQTAFSLMYQGLVLIELARTKGPDFYANARDRFQRAGKILIDAGIHGQAWRTLYYEGLCEYEAAERTQIHNPLRNERLENASRLFKQAADEIDNLRNLASSDEVIENHRINLSIGGDKQELYRMGFQLNAWYRQDTPEAFEWLERMKARALLKALTKRLPPTKELFENDLVKEELRLQDMLRYENESAKRAVLKKCLENILKEMQDSPATSAYAALKQGLPITWNRFRSYLIDEQKKAGSRKIVFAEFYFGPKNSSLLIMRADWESPVYQDLAVRYTDIFDFVNKYFYGKSGLRSMLEDIGEEEWQSFSSLVEPLLLHSLPGDIICLIPNGILHNLPLHTLIVDGQRLIERNPVFYSPSASLLNLIAYRTPSNTISDSKAAGISVLGNSTGNLKYAEEESIAIAEMLGTTAKLRDEVSKEVFSRDLSELEMVHFAGHGELAAKDGFESKLYMAGGNYLTAADILNLTLNNELVVLSGCETGLGVYSPGDEMTGLTSSLLSSGARSLVVSQWRVDDESSKVLLMEFYKLWYGNDTRSKAEALQLAALSICKDMRWQNFYYWGGFVLYGNWN